MKCSNAESINKRIIRLLRSYTDDKYVSITQNKHIKVVGTYSGISRSFLLSLSPNNNYETYIRSYLNRFLQSIGCSNRIAKGDY